MWQGMWPPTHPPPRYFLKGMGSWVISHDWFLLSFLGNCTKNGSRYTHHQSTSTSHSIFNLCTPLCLVKWLAADHFESGCSIISRFSASAFGLTFCDFGLIRDQQLCTSGQHNWSDVAYSEETLRGIMKLKRSEAKLNPSTSQLECFWCLSEIGYCLQEISSGDF